MFYNFSIQLQPEKSSLESKWSGEPPGKSKSEVDFEQMLKNRFSGSGDYFFPPRRRRKKKDATATQNKGQENHRRKQQQKEQERKKKRKKKEQREVTHQIVSVKAMAKQISEEAGEEEGAEVEGFERSIPMKLPLPVDMSALLIAIRMFHVGLALEELLQELSKSSLLARCFCKVGC